MDVSVENSGGLSRRLKVQIPAEDVTAAVDARVRQVGQKARIPGFRPGKAPMKVLYQRYGAKAREEAVGELIQSVYPKALEEAQLTPAGRPEIELDEVRADAPLGFTASFDVYPEIQLQGLDTIEVEKPVVEVGDADVDAAIERVRERNKTWEAVDRQSREGDQVVVDYAGTIDGQAFEGGTGRDTEVTLGENRFLPELERALVGRAAGEAFAVDVNFPADYGAKDLAGKTAHFEVTVKTVSQPKPAELDAAFLQQMGVEDGEIEGLRHKARESLQQEAEHAIDTQVKTQTLDGLLAANPIEVPASMVADEIERMRREAMARMPEQIRSDSERVKQLLPDERLQEDARRRVALGLLIGEVIAQEQLETDADRVSAKIQEIASSYGEDAQQVKQYYQANPQLMQGLQAMVMEEQVVDKLLEGATVTERAMTLDELHDGHRHDTTESS